MFTYSRYTYKRNKQCLDTAGTLTRETKQCLDTAGTLTRETNNVFIQSVHLQEKQTMFRYSRYTYKRNKQCFHTAGTLTRETNNV